MVDDQIGANSEKVNGSIGQIVSFVALTRHGGETSEGPKELLL